MRKVKYTRGRTVGDRLDYFCLRGCGCWPWTASTANGYGVLMVNKRREYAHRLSYARFNGPIPDGLDIDHICRNRTCINPDHLEPVTRGENVRRSPISRPGMFSRGISVARDKHGRFA